jgi:hypothetical protein
MLPLLLTRRCVGINLRATLPDSCRRGTTRRLRAVDLRDVVFVRAMFERACRFSVMCDLRVMVMSGGCTGGWRCEAHTDAGCTECTDGAPCVCVRGVRDRWFCGRAVFAVVVVVVVVVVVDVRRRRNRERRDRGRHNSRARARMGTDDTQVLFKVSVPLGTP